MFTFDLPVPVAPMTTTSGAFGGRDIVVFPLLDINVRIKNIPVSKHGSEPLCPGAHMHGMFLTVVSLGGEYGSTRIFSRR
jgi:hypothetical protein